jgi:hypothetical protein
MRNAATIVLAFALATALAIPTLLAQEPSATEVVSAPLEIRPGSAAKGFDIKRLNSENYGAFVPFYVKETEPLNDALKDGRLASDTPVLVTETAAGPLALLTDQLAYHHLAQGRAGGKDWMATF